MASFSERRVAQLIDLLQPDRLTRVLDIGANPVHDTPYKPLLKMGGCEVWGFEPQPEAYQKLISEKSALEHYAPHALGNGQTATLYVCKSDGFTSILPPNTTTLDFLGRWHKAMTVIETVPVETKRLDDLTDIPAPDLVKIDVQGAEHLIFANAARTLSSTMAVISEVAFIPLYTDQPLFHHQAALLEKYGFLLSKFMFLKKKSLGSGLMAMLNWRKHQNQLIDGDAVFVRNLMSDADYSDEQLKHLAICADAVFESFDLTLKCLSLLLDRGAIDEQQVKDYVRRIPNQKEP